jgi:dGTPase
MRASLKLPNAQQRKRLTERIPPEPLQPDGKPAKGLKGDQGDRARYRTDAQRDRDRLLYDPAFHRLGGVTQVTESELGHTFHTRLTHSLKVAQVARRCAEKLRLDAEAGRLTGRAAALVDTLDPDAVEASALAHDLGHPPFGHVAEETLQRCSPASFEGNAQSFRIVTRLSVRESEPGLSLTRQTLNGMLKYPWLRDDELAFRDKKWGAYASDQDAFEWVRRDSYANQRSLVAHLMDWADDVTYAVHDLDDFYRAGLVPLHLLAARGGELDQLRQGLQEAGREDPTGLITALEDVWGYFDLQEAYEGRDDQRAALRASASTLITQYLDAFTVREGPREGWAELIIDEGARRQVKALKDLTWVYVVMRPSLAVMQAGRRRIIQSLYEWYFAATEAGGDRRLLPPAYQARLGPDATPKARARLVTDLVSSLSEPAALELYRRMSGVDPGSILDAAARVA